MVGIILSPHRISGRWSPFPLRLDRILPYWWPRKFLSSCKAKAIRTLWNDGKPWWEDRKWHTSRDFWNIWDRRGSRRSLDTSVESWDVQDLLESSVCVQTLPRFTSGQGENEVIGGCSRGKISKDCDVFWFYRWFCLILALKSVPSTSTSSHCLRSIRKSFHFAPELT